MGPRTGSFRSRATSLIKSPLATIHQGQYHDPNRERSFSNASQQQTLNEKQEALDNLTSSSSCGQTHSTLAEDTRVRERDAHRIPRTIPSWVHTREEIEKGIVPISPSHDPPGAAQVAQHNSSPAIKANGSTYHQKVHNQEYEKLAHWSGEADPERVSRWKAFTDASAYPHITPDGGRIVSEEWLRDNGPNYYQPWMAGVVEGDPEVGYKSHIRRRAWYLRLERKILRSPIVPMVIRMIVLSFSVVALGLATSIHILVNGNDSVLEQVPSTDMAIIGNRSD
ncbi:uncharacterized protein KY384_007424 [Bacidia gigantensis]|uniref:uncharacterized protein n=1 Tax=Bacidia gigantensis TaxID=2732470 RepID=UPI001D038383|nr:uncharacterized protein KY384_007424 [Bacidia gigantensis]KAG8528506.1 hypothetical protein KY384_007424 [Bacidia gigantensis]